MKSFIKFYRVSSRKPQLRNKGFSLVEVMVVAGLLGGLSLVVSQITKNINSTQKRAEINSEIQNFVTQTQDILTDKQSCIESLNGVVIGGGTTFNNIKQWNSNTATSYNVYSVGTEYGAGANKFSITQMEVVNFASAGTFTDPSTGIVYEFGPAQIEIDLLRGRVGATAAALKSALMGSATLQKVLSVNLVVNQGTQAVTECHGSNDVFIETACHALGGVVDGTGLCTEARIGTGNGGSATGTATGLVVGSQYSGTIGAGAAKVDIPLRVTSDASRTAGIALIFDGDQMQAINGNNPSKLWLNTLDGDDGDVQIGFDLAQDIDVRGTLRNGSANLTIVDDVTVTGNITHTGNVAQTGNVTQTGNNTITGDLVVTQNSTLGDAAGDQVNLDGTIRSTVGDILIDDSIQDPNSNLVVNDTLDVTNDLNVNGNTRLGNAGSDTIDIQGPINNSSGSNGGSVYINDTVVSNGLMSYTNTANPAASGLANNAIPSAATVRSMIANTLAPAAGDVAGIISDVLQADTANDTALDVIRNYVCAAIRIKNAYGTDTLELAPGTCMFDTPDTSCGVNGTCTNVYATQDVWAGDDVIATDSVEAQGGYIRTGTPSSSYTAGDIVSTDDLIADDDLIVGDDIYSGGHIRTGNPSLVTYGTGDIAATDDLIADDDLYVGDRICFGASDCVDNWNITRTNCAWETGLTCSAGKVVVQLDDTTATRTDTVFISDSDSDTDTYGTVISISISDSDTVSITDRYIYRVRCCDLKVD